ncbi:MAG: hypothetical protein HY423_14520 [Candidatus Lambdaproteobacteria bacterium]|nr:hypothetical protein [Candidatus Lambdaproteobacteria bacterium]
MSRWLWVVVAVAALTWFAGCQAEKPPQQEMDAAKASLDAAKQANVDPNAFPDMKKAEDAFNKGKAEVDTQNKKFSLSRDYKNAKASFAEAKMSADKAMADNKAAMEKAAAEKAAAEAAAKKAAEERAKAAAMKKKPAAKKAAKPAAKPAAK